jgi:hypothetical protein
MENGRCPAIFLMENGRCPAYALRREAEKQSQDNKLSASGTKGNEHKKKKKNKPLAARSRESHKHTLTLATNTLTLAARGLKGQRKHTLTLAVRGLARTKLQQKPHRAERSQEELRRMEGLCNRPQLLDLLSLHRLPGILTVA